MDLRSLRCTTLHCKRHCQCLPQRVCRCADPRHSPTLDVGPRTSLAPSKTDRDRQHRASRRVHWHPDLEQPSVPTTAPLELVSLHRRRLAEAAAAAPPPSPSQIGAQGAAGSYSTLLSATTLSRRAVTERTGTVTSNGLTCPTGPESTDTGDSPGAPTALAFTSSGCAVTPAAHSADAATATARTAETASVSSSASRAAARTTDANMSSMTAAPAPSLATGRTVISRPAAHTVDVATATAHTADAATTTTSPDPLSLGPITVETGTRAHVSVSSGRALGTTAGGRMSITAPHLDASALHLLALATQLGYAATLRLEATPPPEASPAIVD
jgi:hypothetical protein